MQLIRPSLGLIFYFWIAQNTAAGGDNADCNPVAQPTLGRLKETLLCGYETNIKSVISMINNATVKLSLQIKSLSFEYASGDVSVLMALKATWNDDYLKWKPEEYDNINSVQLKADDIWVPQIYVTSGKDYAVEPSLLIGSWCNVSPNGTVRCITIAKHSSICECDLTDWPYDKQKCTFYYTSPYTEKTRFLLQQEGELVDEKLYGIAMELQIIEAKLEQSPMDESGSSQELELTLNLIRQPDFHSATIVAPTLAMASLSVMSAWLDPERQERIGLAAISIFAHFSSLEFFSWLLPSEGYEVPRLVKFHTDSMVLCASIIILTIILRSVSHVATQTPLWLSTCLDAAVSSKFGQILCMDSGPQYTAEADKRQNEEDSDELMDRSTPTRSDWNLFAAILDKVFFYMLIVTYAILIKTKIFF